MNELSHIRSAVEWYYPDLAAHITVNQELQFYGVNQQLGFLAVQAEQGYDASLIGFTHHRVGTSLAKPFFSVTNFDDVPESEKTIGRQGKGVGTRLYNSIEAVAGTLEGVQDVDAVLFSVNYGDVLDERNQQTFSNKHKVFRLARHAVRSAKSEVLGLDRVVADIHAGFGDARIVFQPQPPRSELRRGVLRGIAPDTVLAHEAFALIRDPELPLHIVGRVK